MPANPTARNFCFSLFLTLLLSGCGGGEDLTVYVSRTASAEKVDRVLSILPDVEAVTGRSVRIQTRPLWGSGENGWLVLDSDTLEDYGIHSEFSEPVDNLIFAWLQETLGIIWPAPGDVAVFDVKKHWIPFHVWRKEWEQNSAREGYLTRKFYHGSYVAAERAWDVRNKSHEFLSFNHSHFRIIPPSLFDESPHLFAKDKDGQPMRPQAMRLTGFSDHPDLREREVAERVAAAAIAAFDRDPSPVSFSISGNDSFIFGHYPEDDPFVDTGRYFRRYIDYSHHVFDFSNRVAEKVAAVYPDKYLGALAYMSWENVPDFPVHPKIIPYLTVDRTQWYDEDFREEDLDLVSDWVNAGPEIVGTWDYIFGYGFLIPRSPVTIVTESIQLLHQRGVRAYFAQTSALWGYDAHVSWLMKQLLWDVNQDAKHLLDQYFQAYYGPAAEPMRKFFDHAEKLWMNQPGKAVWLRYYIDAHQAGLYSREDLKVMRGLLEQAKEKVERRKEKVGLSNGVSHADRPTIQPPNNPTAPQSTHLRRVQNTLDLFELTEAFIEYVHLKWAISLGDVDGFDFSWGEWDFLDVETLERAIARLDMLEDRFREIRAELIKNPLHRHVGNTDWALAGDPRGRVRAESGGAVRLRLAGYGAFEKGGGAVRLRLAGYGAIEKGGGAVDSGDGSQLEASNQKPAASDQIPAVRSQLSEDSGDGVQELAANTQQRTKNQEPRTQNQAPSTLVPDWKLWPTHWRRHIMDTEDATLVLEDDVVRAENIRRGQLFRTMRAEEGTTYQAKVGFRGQIGPSSNVFVRLDWYDKDLRPLGRTAIDRLPPGVYEEALTIGPVAEAPEGTKYVRLFIRFYEMEPGDVLLVSGD